MSEKAQQKAPEASVQQGFHCSCFARNENLAIMCSFLVSLSDEIIRLANLLYATYRKRIV